MVPGARPWRPVGPATARLLARLPAPPIVCYLMPDDLIKDRLQDPAKSMAFYRAQVRRRQKLRASGQVYTFPPFITTLTNMHKLTRHILADLQFSQPLSEPDRIAFRLLDERTEALLAQNAPYEATVQQAILMTAMLEVVTARYVLSGRHHTAPTGFSSAHCAPAGADTGLTPFVFCLPTADGGMTQPPTAKIPLARLLSCAWGAARPSDQDQTTSCLWLDNDKIASWLKDDSIFLYPSFEPLGLKDFCRFSHLPVYPLGMMNSYALCADGRLQTPMQFLAHDIEHTRQIESFRCKDSTEPLESAASRLQFRQLVMDTLPASLRPFGLDRALTLLVFIIFHEYAPVSARRRLDVDSFLPLLYMISTVRGKTRGHYTPEDMAITDLQALLSCLWLHRAYRFWCDHPGQPLDAIARSLDEQLTRQLLPVLLGCLEFVDKHRPALTWYFLEQAEAQATTPLAPESARRYKSRSPWAHHYFGRALTVPTADQNPAKEPAASLYLLFLDALHTPGERQKIQERLGEAPPSGAL